MARRKKRRNNILIVIGIVILAVFFYLGSQQFSLEDLPEGMGGATIFSIDTVQMQGRDVESTEWVIALSMNDGAESVTGEISAEDINRFNLQSVPATSFKIEFALRNPSCRYDIVKDDNVIGETYYAFVTEQCLANVCPYNAIDLDDIIQACRNQLQSNPGETEEPSPFAMSQIPSVSGKDCERMIDFKQLQGAYTEWCYWLPEESNVDALGECRDHTISQDITVSTNPAGCGRWREDTTTVTMKITEGETGGDWQVMSAGIVPSHEIYRISSAEMFNYEAVVKVTVDATGEEFECIIDPVTKVCELGDFGNVKFAGNLLADKGCPDPGNDEIILRDVDTQEWFSVDSGPGSSLNAYLSAMNTMKQSNIDHYTFTAVPVEEIETQTTWGGGGCDPGVGNPIFPITTSMNNLYKRIPKEEPVIDYNCDVIDNNIYECKSGGSVVYPLLKLTVKASKVGLFVPNGQPKIIGISTDRSKATDPESTLTGITLDPSQLKKLYIGVQNVGSEDDSFDVSLDCPFPISQQSARVAVESTEIGIAELVVSGTGLIQNCEIRANSVGFPLNRDAEEVHVVINPSCDQIGIPGEEQIFTEYGCIALMAFPEEPCSNDEFWLTNLRRCVGRDEIKTGEQRLEILEEVAKTDCQRQCNGNKECTLACLDLGNVKPVCVGQRKMMALNNYLCDYENQPNLIVPTEFRNKVWFDVPVCDYVCKYGFEGNNCEITSGDQQFSYDDRPGQAQTISGGTECETCFDGVKNQDEGDIDCDGICFEKYGKDKECGKLRAPDHCYNHLDDGDEEGRDCGGSCEFECDVIYRPAEIITTEAIPSYVWVLFLVLAVIIGSLVFFNFRKRRTGRRRR